MRRPTTIRIPEDLLEDIDRFVQERNLDRSNYLREILRKGFLLDKQEKLFEKYVGGAFSMSEVCEALRVDPWQFLKTLKDKSLHLNVSLEDFLDSAQLND
jgi:metal-responsive CopG/Arc/MetJ family transcriptional regulator